MKPWIIMGMLLLATLLGRWFIWAYPNVLEASAHIGTLLSSSTFS